MPAVQILGVSCDYHDAAAALVVDGELVAAAEQERFSRVKHDRDLPVEAIGACLRMAGVDAGDVDVVAFHEKPLLVMGRVLAARQRRGPLGVAGFVRDFPVLLRRNLLVGYRLDRALRDLGSRRSPEIAYAEHHLSHAAAAFYPSPFPTAAVLTIDGIGEWATGAIGQGLHHRLELIEEQRFPHSLGLLYSLATVWCGFEANEGEYKVMGLAPFGEPTYLDALRRLVDVHDDGSITVDVRAARWWSGDPRRMRRLVEAFDGPPRRPGDPLTQRDRDLARSVQALTEEAVLRMARHAHDLTGERDLVMAGGVALNCVANGRLLREGPFERIWVQPAAGDAGSAVGAALWYWHEERRNRRDRTTVPVGELAPDAMAGAALGPSFAGDEVEAWLDREGVDHEVVADPDERCRRVADRLAEGAVVGWFEGRMEFGPRALGHRSILADPRSATVQRDLNVRVKGRESFRPFAPAVLWEHAAEWFDLDRPSPYMLFTFPVAAERLVPVDQEPDDPYQRVQVVRSQIPACTHVDGSARVQTVHPEIAPAFHRLLEAFHRRTGCPVLLNTSFNVAGEPIVCTPDQALATARAAGLDLLVLDDRIVELGRVPAVPAGLASSP
jgi:carbamoyltransferase